jgi:hypothetical protein
MHQLELSKVYGLQGGNRVLKTFMRRRFWRIASSVTIGGDMVGTVLSTTSAVTASRVMLIALLKTIWKMLVVSTSLYCLTSLQLLGPLHRSLLVDRPRGLVHRDSQ